MTAPKITYHQNPQWDVAELVAYATVAAGYLLGVIAAAHLTLGGFLAVSGVHLAWLLVLRRLPARTPVPPLALVALFVIACLGMLEAWVGMGFDWLLPIVSIGVVCTCLSVRASAIFAGSLLAATIGILLVLNEQASAALGQNLTSLVPAFLFVFAFSCMARRQTEQRERAEQLVRDLEASQAALQAAHAQLQAYTEQVEELTVTRERNHIAREIHDTLGHFLTILALQLETATQLEARGDPQVRGALAEARHSATECLAAVRHSVATLRPADPTGVALVTAMQRLVAEFTAVSPQTAVTLDLDGPAQTVAPEARVALLRAAQEALTNIRKHADTTKVLVRLRVESDHAELAVIDNGCRRTAALPPGFGLQGMRERVALLGGTMTAQPAPERGWRVEVCLPLAATAAASAPRLEGVQG